MRRSWKWDSKGFINPLAGGEWGVTPYSVGRCHTVTEGTGDRWEQSPHNKAVNQAQRWFTDTSALLLSACLLILNHQRNIKAVFDQTRQKRLFVIYVWCIKSPTKIGDSVCRKSLTWRGNALSCRAFPLQKQSTGLFLNSPFAERLSAVWGVAPLPTRGSASGLRQRVNKPFGIPRAASPLFIDTLLNNIRKSFRMLYLSWVLFILFRNPCYRIKTVPVTAWLAVNFSAFFFAHFFIGNEFFHIIQHLP